MIDSPVYRDSTTIDPGFEMYLYNLAVIVWISVVLVITEEQNRLQ